MNEQEKMMVIDRGVEAGLSGEEMLAEIAAAEGEEKPEVVEVSEPEEETPEPTEIEETVEVVEPEDEAEAES
jgi:hypothetical protein